MSESSPPAVPADAAVPAPEVKSPLSPEQRAAVLRDFESWLTELHSTQPPPEVGRIGNPPFGGEEQGRGIDLNTLLGQFLALRHEVNLQTRAVRAQQEQNSDTLRQLSQALERLREQQAQGDQDREADADQLLAPLLKTLIDLYDALALASREVQRIQEGVLPLLHQLAVSVPEGELPALPDVPPEPDLPRWGRWLGVKRADTTPLRESASRLLEQYRQERYQRRQQWEQLQTVAERIRLTLTALLTGYTMSLQRLDRALQQHGLEPIQAVGSSFDPELMEVLEAVPSTGRPAGEVLEVVRRGYLYNDRVFRYAQVRVARG